MNTTAVFYGSTTGNTETIAKQIAGKLNADIYNVADNPIDKIAEYQNLILGTSTWGLGDLQDDWDSFLPKLAKTDLTGKTIALFGLGDSSSYPDTFVDGMGAIFDAIKSKACTIVKVINTTDYNFSDSKAIVDGYFVGLPLDEDNESNLTNNRIDNWIEEIKQFLINR
ncbi:MAG: flavodoxin [Paludibacteraceae bacterium]|nr:flavodoxin [Paludibacteraceae bacterium]